jgi:RND superfamily putative drug exporter
MTATVTGVPALFHDLNRNASEDMLRAERFGIPLALAILLIVFRAPLAAALPLLVAMVSVTLASAGLYLLRGAFPVSVFAQNTVAMIGFAVGVDYALFLVAGFRARLAQGDALHDAVVRAAVSAGHAVLVSGIAVGIGFAGLLLVKAKFVHSVALGGFLVVGSAVAVTLTLLPVLLRWLGPWVNWPLASNTVQSSEVIRRGPWERWVAVIMHHPWYALLLGLAIVVALAAPTARMTAVNAGVMDLAPQLEARRGFESLQRNFVAGWMGPVALLVETTPGRSLYDDESRRAIQAIAARLENDPRVARIQIDPRGAITPDGATALLVIVTEHGPSSAEGITFVRMLRADRWPEAAQAGLTVRVGGPSAMLDDFDAEMLGSLWRVVPAVLVITFIVLLVAFRSVIIPLKAIALNLLAVMAAYGFLVLVFQDGIGAPLMGIEPPGGLNSLVVLMLFTVLFGISMDYEVFLLQQIREEYRRTGDNRRSVETGVARSSSLIVSAAAIMVVLFGSFGFTQFTATREFGLGLAFAVALDATVIRLLLVPALMELFGAANWWWPLERARTHPLVQRKQGVNGMKVGVTKPNPSGFGGRGVYANNISGE